jgi:hypothetical protein
VSDPVADEIARATEGLTESDASEFESHVRSGLDHVGPAATPEGLAAEVTQAADVPPGERVRWARQFEAKQEVRQLSGRSWRLLEDFKAGARPPDDLRSDASALLEEARSFDLSRLDDPELEELRYELGDVEMECRFVLSGGTGPVSLRGGKLFS